MGHCLTRQTRNDRKPRGTQEAQEAMGGCEMCSRTTDLLKIEHLQSGVQRIFCENCLSEWHACVIRIVYNPKTSQLLPEFSSLTTGQGSGMVTDELLEEKESLPPSPASPTSPSFIEGLLKFQDIDIAQKKIPRIPSTERLFQKEELNMYRLVEIGASDWTHGDYANLTRRNDWNVLRAISNNSFALFVAECQSCSYRGHLEDLKDHKCRTCC
jgi:hypothetical protein